MLPCLSFFRTIRSSPRHRIHARSSFRGVSQTVHLSKLARACTIHRLRCSISPLHALLLAPLGLYPCALFGQIVTANVIQLAKNPCNCQDKADIVVVRLDCKHAMPVSAFHRHVLFSGSHNFQQYAKATTLCHTSSCTAKLKLPHPSLSFRSFHSHAPTKLYSCKSRTPRRGCADRSATECSSAQSEGVESLRGAEAMLRILLHLHFGLQTRHPAMSATGLCRVRKLHLPGGYGQVCGMFSMLSTTELLPAGPSIVGLLF